MKTVAYILLAIFLSAQTPLGQVFKLPVLIEHFSWHQKQDGVSLWEFLIDHYSQKHHDADWPEDEQLPFKTIVLCSIGFAILPALPKQNFVFKFYTPRNELLNDVHKPQQHLCSIFHPPR